MIESNGRSRLVSVGLPTYNRLDTLIRAVRSILEQDYPCIEVIISDNASIDGTQAWCEELCRRDSRVHYVRQQCNIGPTANHREVFLRSRGEFYMVIGDDDWLEPAYISRCVQALLSQDDLVLVCGIPRLVSDQAIVRVGNDKDLVNLLHDSGSKRVLDYYRGMSFNALFYGVVRREVLMTIPPMKNVVGGDWLYLSSLTFKGKVKTLESAVINKSAGGASESWGNIARTAQLPWYQARFPRISLTACIFADIAWVSAAYKSMRWERLVLAIKVLTTLLLLFLNPAVLRPLVLCYHLVKRLPFARSI